MDNIIKFPSSVYEKERELKILELDLAIESLKIKRESQKVKNARREIFFKKIFWFSSGIIVGFLVCLT